VTWASSAMSLDQPPNLDASIRSLNQIRELLEAGDSAKLIENLLRPRRIRFRKASPGPVMRNDA